MLCLEDDLLNRLDPLVSARFCVGREGVASLARSKLEARLIRWVAR